MQTPALLLLVDYFQESPQYFSMPGLFDSNFSQQEFKEYESLLDQEYTAIPVKFEDAYFLASYFSAYFRQTLQQINNSLIPKHKFETHDSLDGLTEE